MLTIHISYCNHVYKRINAFECTCMNNIIHTYTHGSRVAMLIYDAYSLFVAVRLFFVLFFLIK